MLLLKLKPQRGGFWQPVTGGVEPGEALDVAALREATEESGLQFIGPPQSLDYQFNYRTRDREFQEHTYWLTTIETDDRAIRLDPNEHVEHQWIKASQATPLLKHASNAEGLSRLLKALAHKPALSLLLWFFFLSAALGTPSALASQSGIIIADNAEVHQKPDAASPQISTLSKGTENRIGSRIVRGSHSEYWYKIRLIDGALGYVRAKDVKTQQIDQALKFAGMDQERGKENERDFEERIWLRNFRAMGILGYEVNSKSLEPGGELEGSFSLYPSSGGYRQRQASLGLAFQAMTTELVLAASLIYRFYTEGRVEPEARLRVGEGLTSGSVVAGFNFGVRYPFSLDSEERFDAYVEGGTLGSFDANAPVHIFGTAGVGYHF